MKSLRTPLLERRTERLARARSCAIVRSRKSSSAGSSSEISSDNRAKSVSERELVDLAYYDHVNAAGLEFNEQGP